MFRHPAIGALLPLLLLLLVAAFFAVTSVNDAQRQLTQLVQTPGSDHAMAIGSVMGKLRVALLLGAVMALAAALLTHWLIHRGSKQALSEMRLAARRLAEGNFDATMFPPDSPELAEFANAMNRMAKLLDERIRTAVAERNEREAILSSMVEGVIAVDTVRRIISMNEAAARLFDADPARVQGKSIQHAVRNPRMTELIDDTLAQHEPVVRELTVHSGGREIVVKAHAAGLRDDTGAAIGVVVVLDDITDLRRLERVRSDFVANVSHELKTPITSIKGFVETLLDGALDDREEAERFLGIVARQADRLNAIIEDLLILSRIEQGEQAQENLLSPGMLQPVVQSALQLCAGAAAAKNIAVSATCPQGLRARINAPLLEQGLTNLIDNAIKYSEPGSEVRMEVTDGAREIAIAVIDQGNGIAAEHLPRLFERFYRVDRARSRQIGGTGLGLAIVKHIAQTHGGRVEVESRPGIGSVFHLLLPKLQPAQEPLELVV